MNRYAVEINSFAVGQRRIYLIFLLLFQVGQMIQAESVNTKREEYLNRLMSLPNQVPQFYLLPSNFATILA